MQCLWSVHVRYVAGIMSIEHADFDGIERLALVLGGEIVSTFEHPEDVKLGFCKQINEIMIGEDKLIHFSGMCLMSECWVWELTVLLIAYVLLALQ